MWIVDPDHVKVGTKLEDAIAQPRAKYLATDGHGRNVWEDLQKITPKKKKKKKKKSQKMSNVVAKSEKDLDRRPANHPKLAALPSDAQPRKELAKLSPKIRKYACVMMDPGASHKCRQYEEALPMACKLTAREHYTTQRRLCKHREW